MIYSNPEIATHVLAEARNILGKEEPDIVKADHLWRTLAYFRANLLAVLLRNTIGSHVYSGPFKGMQLTPAAMGKAFGPVLIGCYEHELHPTFERVIAHPYKRILNIGCAFGYYAIGLALRMPQVTVHAFDISANAQQQCRDMATLNGVQDRVHVSGEFRGEDFAPYADGETLVLMDIEGAEMALLDPALYPALRKMDVIVELHDVYNPAISQTILSRFAATHTTELVLNKPILFDFEPLTGPVYTDPFDSIIITWDNRDGPTPWAVMRAR